MKKTCVYCGHIHPRGYRCPKQPKAIKHRTHIEKFRSSAAWQRKRDTIVHRDLFLCRLCLESGEMSGDVQVHHITPLTVDFSKCLDDDNLISLCPYHHELAESGKIPAEHLRELAKQAVADTPRA